MNTIEKLRRGRQVAWASITASLVLATANIAAGYWGHSTSVTAAGLEFAGDVIASALVLLGMWMAAKPADADHPYGHGRFETLSGLIVGIILALGGAGICYRSIQRAADSHQAPHAYAIWPLIAAILIRSVMSSWKFRVGRRIQSASLVADAWNDAVDILSATGALVAVALAIHDPQRFLAADHYGGFAVGLVVIFTGVRVMRETTLDLVDTMPDEPTMQAIAAIARQVPGVLGIDKLYARRTGLQLHVDLHIEVDPQLTVEASHVIAGQVRRRLKAELDWVADVLVHVEPAPDAEE